MYPLQKACKKIKGCVYGRDAAFIRKLVTRFGSRNEYFYMRDYGKSGMTIPHKVIRAVLEGFYRRTPEKAQRACRFFEHGVAYSGESNSDADRIKIGAPLGLFVEGYTLLQYAIFELNLQDMGPGDHLDFSATNDDMIVGGPEERVLHFQQVDVVTNHALGMFYKDTKSGITQSGFVFCEEYWLDGELLQKEGLVTMALLAGKYACNVVQAKDYVHSVLMAYSSVDSDKIRQIVREVQSVYDWEFSEQEVDWPYLFGGWLPQYIDGVDHSLEWYNGDAIAGAAYWAARATYGKPGELDKPHLALGRKSKIELIAKPEAAHQWLDLVPYLGTKRTLRAHFSLESLHPKLVAK